MRIGIRHRVLAAALAAATLPSTPTALAQCEELESQWQRVELNVGSGIPAPIVENAGQLADDVAFGAVSAAGTGARFHANGRVDLVLMHLEDKTRIGFVPVDADGPAALSPTEPLYGTVVYLGPGSPGTLDAFAGLEARGLYGDAVIEHRMTGRTWRMHLSGPAGDLGRLALQPDGIAEIVRDEASGELHLTPADDPQRRLTLFPAEVRVGDDISHLPFLADADGTLRLDGEVPEGAELETLMVLAPYAHSIDAVADGRGGYLAAGTAVDALGTEEGSGRDVAVLRTAEDGRSFQGLTILASSGDDSAAGISSRHGEAYVVGSAGASDFPIAKAGSGGFPAPFALRLGTDGAAATGAYLRPAGVETAADVAVDGDGRVLIAGVATAEAKSHGEMSLTTVLPTADEAPQTGYVLTELDADLGFAEHAQVFMGQVTELPIRVRPACEGQVSVGLEETAALFACLPRWNRHPYPSNQPSPWSYWYYDGYADALQPGPLTDSWGYHALRWKNFHIIGSNYVPSAVPSTVPKQQVGFLDNVALNALEADPLVFTTGDPAGTWLRNDAYDYLELAIGAAAYAAFWGSPTYANLRYDTGIPGGGFLTGAVAITETEFCSDPASIPGGPGPIELCQDIACTSPPCRFPIDDWDDVCAADPVISDTSKLYLNRFVYSHWDPARAGYAEGEEEIYWVDVRTRFDQASPNRYYVADPPVGAEFARSFVAEGVQRELARMVEDVPVEITVYAAGEPVSVKAGRGLVRAVDRMP